MQTQTFTTTPGAQPIQMVQAPTSQPWVQAPTSQPIQMVPGSQPWAPMGGFSGVAHVKKRRTDKSYPGIPRGYWWSDAEAAEAKSKGEYIKVNGGDRNNIASKPQGFSFEATILKGAPFKKRTNRKTRVENPNAYSGQGLHIVFLDTFTYKGQPTINARLSGDPRDIAFTLLFANKVVFNGVPFVQIQDEQARQNIVMEMTGLVIAQSYNYFTIVESQGKGKGIIEAMDAWDTMKNTNFYKTTAMYYYISNQQLRNLVVTSIPGDLFSRFVEEASKRISDKDSKESGLASFQQDLLLYIFLSHHVRGPDCRKVGPDGHDIEPYTLPGSSRKHTFASLLMEVYNDPSHVVDISNVIHGKGYRKAKTPKISKKDGGTRAKGVPVNFSVNLGGQFFTITDKVYSNNEGSVQQALAELGVDSNTISNVKAQVKSLLKIKLDAKLSKQSKSTVQGQLIFDQKGASCQVSHYPTTPYVAGHVSNVAASAAQILAEEQVSEL